MAHIRVAMFQFNAVVGALSANAAQICGALAWAEDQDADIVVFPELAITGYPPEDLLLKPGFVSDNLKALAEIAETTQRTTAVVGFVDRELDLYNAAAICQDGEVKGVYRKQMLPNYSVFDEQRYFSPGSGASELYSIAGVNVGISICEDAWIPSGPVGYQAAAGAELVVNINASPFYAGKSALRRQIMATRAADASCSLVYLNLVGGQDELVFDGGSMVFDENGQLVAALPQFEPAQEVVDLSIRPLFRKRLLDPRGREEVSALPIKVLSEPAATLAHPGIDAKRPIVDLLEPEEEMYAALVLGTKDYVNKNGFSDVVIGLSGGVDSSLVAAIAVDAVGPDHVHGVAMPSRYSSEMSLTDARDLSTRLGISCETVEIEPAHQALVEIVDAASQTKLPDQPDLTEENLQSRIRGTILMAISNRQGWMVLTTGNKSEAAVGYSTLYGDTAGGFAVIKDVPKTWVYRLCHWRNRTEELIPPSILTKAPSAELRPDQRDDQSLPPYEVLDPLLETYVEGDMTSAELVEAGFAPDLVSSVVAMVDRAEYKRRQSPPGVRVTPKAFGKDRRLPITSSYR